MIDYDNYGEIDLSYHDTTPGAKSPFAPPAGFSGDEEAYLAYMRRRYRQDPGASQHMAVTVWLYDRSQGHDVEIAGPYRELALRVIKGLSRHSGASKKEVEPAPELALT